VVGLVIRIERLAVYNLHVAELHSYAVGEVRERLADRHLRVDSWCITCRSVELICILNICRT